MADTGALLHSALRRGQISLRPSRQPPPKYLLTPDPTIPRRTGLEGISVLVTARNTTSRAAYLPARRRPSIFRRRRIISRTTRRGGLARTRRGSPSTLTPFCKCESIVCRAQRRRPKRPFWDAALNSGQVLRSLGGLRTLAPRRWRLDRLFDEIAQPVANAILDRIDPVMERRSLAFLA